MSESAPTAALARPPREARSPSFSETVRRHGLRLDRVALTTLQVNVGKRCNQACLHCHVEAGPKRTERMEGATVDRILELLAASRSVKVVDVTGGAPELNAHFRRLVSGARALGMTVMDRCNLTVLSEPGQEDTPEFLAAQQVIVVASLPCYSQVNVDKQRGKGVFEGSLRGLRRLNELGYGRPGSGLELNLVYNPGGPFLPPAQASLEADYKRRLEADFGIVFNHLFTITNMPIRRFLWDLERSGRLDEYMQLLVEAFNPQAAEGVMCRELLSVGWDGQLYDCDFNQMLELPVPGARRTLWEIDALDELGGGPIALRDHCYGCTAGAGSSCGGALS